MYAEREKYETKFSKYRLLSASDAHELGFVGMAPCELKVDTVSAHGILQVLKKSLM
jgi:hypothetical protein